MFEMTNSFLGMKKKTRRRVERNKIEIVKEKIMFEKPRHECNEHLAI